MSLVLHEYATNIHPKPVSRVEYLGEGDRPDRACSSFLLTVRLDTFPSQFSDCGSLREFYQHSMSEKRRV